MAGLAMAGSLGRVDEALAVDEPDLLIGGVPRNGLGDAPAVEDAVGLDELAGQDHAGRPQRMLRPVVVPRRVVSVPDQLDAFAHARLAARNAG